MAYEERRCIKPANRAPGAAALNVVLMLCWASIAGSVFRVGYELGKTNEELRQQNDYLAAIIRIADQQ